jgi:hypothetical protein
MDEGKNAFRDGDSCIDIQSVIVSICADPEAIYIWARIHCACLPTSQIAINVPFLAKGME